MVNVRVFRKDCFKQHSADSVPPVSAVHEKVLYVNDGEPVADGADDACDCSIAACTEDAEGVLIRFFEHIGILRIVCPPRVRVEREDIWEKSFIIANDIDGEFLHGMNL